MKSGTTTLYPALVRTGIIFLNNAVLGSIVNTSVVTCRGMTRRVLHADTAPRDHLVDPRQDSEPWAV